jgi:hypothetical protein
MKCSVPLLFYGNIDLIYTMEGQNSRNQQGPSRMSAREQKTGQAGARDAVEAVRGTIDA